MDETPFEELPLKERPGRSRRRKELEAVEDLIDSVDEIRAGPTEGRASGIGKVLSRFGRKSP